MAKGYAEALALIEAGKQMAMAMKPERPERTPRDKKDKEIDVLALLEQKRREYLALKNFVDEQAKLNKPDEKKEDKKKKWFEEVDKVALFLLATMPVNWAVMWLLTK